MLASQLLRHHELTKDELILEAALRCLRVKQTR